MRFSTIISTALAASIASAIPLKGREVTVTDWTVTTITDYATLFPGATASSSPHNAIQQGGRKNRSHHHHNSRTGASVFPSAASSSCSEAVPTAAPSTPTDDGSAAPSTTTDDGSAATSTTSAGPAATSTTENASSPSTTTGDGSAAATSTGDLPVITSTTQAASSPITTDQVPPPPSSTSSAPASQPTTSGTTAGTCSAWSAPDLSTPIIGCGVSVLDVANKWRAKYNKSLFTWDATIAGAAKKTEDYNQGGVTEVHPGLVDGSEGECITPGFWEIGDIKTEGYSPFEVALFGWLCEVPSDTQLAPENNDGHDVCAISKNQANIDSSGETGHHDIFLGDYKTIGVYYENNANGDGGWPQFAGQWAADFGR